MGGVLVSKNIEGFVKSILFDQAVSGKISTRGVACDQVLFREEALSSCIVPRGEVNLRKPKGVLVVFCCRSAYESVESK